MRPSRCGASPPELGAGTMTLYHYVRTKDELVTLVSDQIMASW